MVTEGSPPGLSTCGYSSGYALAKNGESGGLTWVRSGSAMSPDSVCPEWTYPHIIWRHLRLPWFLYALWSRSAYDHVLNYCNPFDMTDALSLVVLSSLVAPSCKRWVALVGGSKISMCGMSTLHTRQYSWFNIHVHPAKSIQYSCHRETAHLRTTYFPSATPTMIHRTSWRGGASLTFFDPRAVLP